MMGQYHIMPSGGFPSINGQPTLITKEQWQACCCTPGEIMTYEGQSNFWWGDNVDSVVSDIEKRWGLGTRLGEISIYHLYHYVFQIQRTPVGYLWGALTAHKGGITNWGSTPQAFQVRGVWGQLGWVVGVNEEEYFNPDGYKEGDEMEFTTPVIPAHSSIPFEGFVSTPFTCPPQAKLPPKEMWSDVDISTPNTQIGISSVFRAEFTPI